VTLTTSSSSPIPSKSGVSDLAVKLESSIPKLQETCYLPTLTTPPKLVESSKPKPCETSTLPSSTRAKTFIESSEEDLDSDSEDREVNSDEESSNHLYQLGRAISAGGNESSDERSIISTLNARSNNEQDASMESDDNSFAVCSSGGGQQDTSKDSSGCYDYQETLTPSYASSDTTLIVKENSVVESMGHHAHTLPDSCHDNQSSRNCSCSTSISDSKENSNGLRVKIGSKNPTGLRITDVRSDQNRRENSEVKSTAHQSASYVGNVQALRDEDKEDYQLHQMMQTPQVTGYMINASSDSEQGTSMESDDNSMGSATSAIEMSSDEESNISTLNVRNDNERDNVAAFSSWKCSCSTSTSDTRENSHCLIVKIGIKYLTGVRVDSIQDMWKNSEQKDNYDCRDRVLTPLKVRARARARARAKGCDRGRNQQDKMVESSDNGEEISINERATSREVRYEPSTTSVNGSNDCNIGDEENSNRKDSMAEEPQPINSVNQLLRDISMKTRNSLDRYKSKTRSGHSRSVREGEGIKPEVDVSDQSIHMGAVCDESVELGSAKQIEIAEGVVAGSGTQQTTSEKIPQWVFPYVYYDDLDEPIDGTKAPSLNVIRHHCSGTSIRGADANADIITDDAMSTRTLSGGLLLSPYVYYDDMEESM
jgi:hypothetical protein